MLFIEDMLPVHLSHFHLRFFTQTLTKLYFYNNQMGEKGVQCLADALKNSTVNLTLSSSISFISSLFHTDTHTSPSLRQPNQRQWGPTFR
jgi:hypothetical protein